VPYRLNEREIMNHIVRYGTIALAVFFLWVEVVFFGHDPMPATDAELLGDGLCAVAVIIVALSKWEYPNV
jgi:hypothetical protein